MFYLTQAFVQLFPLSMFEATIKYSEKPIPFLTVCISCTSSWSSRLALQKTLLFPSFIWAAKNGHLVTVAWVALWLAGGGWLAGSWELLLLICGVTSGELLASWIEQKGTQGETRHSFWQFCVCLQYLKYEQRVQCITWAATSLMSAVQISQLQWTSHTQVNGA